jgi:hypothetical protein
MGFANAGNPVDLYTDTTVEYWEDFVNPLPCPYWTGTCASLTAAQNAVPPTAPLAYSKTGACSNWRQTVENEVVNARNHFGIPTGDNNSIIFLSLPASLGYPCGECAEHGFTTLVGSVAGPYIVMPAHPAGGAKGVICPLTADIQHEVAETITDPNGINGWSDASGSEIGDNLGVPGYPTPNTTWDTYPVRDAAYPNGDYYIQPLWDNQANNFTGGIAWSFATRTDTFGLLRSTSPDVVHCEVDPPGSSSSCNHETPSVNPNSEPASVSALPGWIDVFYSDDSRIVRHNYTRDGWATQGWDDWGAPSACGYSMGSPAAVSQHPGMIDVFVTCKNTSTATPYIWRRTYDNYNGSATAWSTVAPLPFNALASVAATSDQDGSIDLFYFDNNSPQHLRHGYMRSNSGTFSWNDWGAWSTKTMQGRPGAASWHKNRWDVFGVATDGSVVTWYCDNCSSLGYSNWGTPGGTIYGSPGVVALSDGRLSVSVNSGNTTIYQRQYRDNVQYSWVAYSAGSINLGIGSSSMVY